MLSEHFVASISAPTKPNTGVTKDAGIFFHEFQPLVAQRHVYKKSASLQNGLAVSKSHVFAAQEGKAVVHVYNREKGNQEAIVPFPERIHSIALAANDMVLLLGTESGRILAWEICSGRLVSTSTSHLEPVSSIAVDAASHFFLSGSKDAIVHVWSLAAILSFSPDTSRSPIQTLSTHRGPITSLVCGHSSSAANIAISISQDKSAIVWDYLNGQTLRTYLLPEVPAALCLDAADRAFYVAYEDGSLQSISFFDDVQHSTSVDLLRDPSRSHAPIQPSSRTRFDAESQKLGGAVSLSLSWDGTTLLSGHKSGKVATWDIAKGNYLSTLTTLPGPVTNLHFLAPQGFASSEEPNIKVHAVVKPKQDTESNSTGLVPANYNLNVQLVGRIATPSLSTMSTTGTPKTDFQDALDHQCFPLSMLEDSLAELETWNAPANGAVAPAADFMSLSAGEGATEDGVQRAMAGTSKSQEDQTQELRKQLASLQRIQKVTFSQMSSLRQENAFLLAKEKKRARQKQLRSEHKRGRVNGDNDVEMKGTGELAETSESESDDSDDDADEDSEEDESD